MKQLFQRLLEPTPDFFKNIRQIAATIALLATVIVALQAQGYELPVIVTSALNFYTLSGSLIATFISSLTSIWRKPDGTINQVVKDKWESDNMAKADKRLADKDEK